MNISMAGELRYSYRTQTVDLDDGHFEITTTCKVFAGAEIVARGSCHDSTREYVFVCQIENQLDAGLAPERVALKLVEMQRAVSRVDAIEKMCEETQGGIH
jgi:hypothetical protein